MDALGIRDGYIDTRSLKLSRFAIRATQKGTSGGVSWTKARQGGRCVYKVDTRNKHSSKANERKKKDGVTSLNRKRIRKRRKNRRQ